MCMRLFHSFVTIILDHCRNVFTFGFSLRCFIRSLVVLNVDVLHISNTLFIKSLEKHLQFQHCIHLDLEKYLHENLTTNLSNHMEI